MSRNHLNHRQLSRTYSQSNENTYHESKDKKSRHNNRKSAEWATPSEISDYADEEWRSKLTKNWDYQNNPAHPNHISPRRKSYNAHTHKNFITNPNPKNNVDMLLNKIDHKFTPNANDIIINKSDPINKLAINPNNKLPEKLSTKPDLMTKSVKTDKLLKSSSKDILSNKVNIIDTAITSFVPVSIILSIENNLILDKDNGYGVKFNIGMLDGKTISINDVGDIISFKDAGSYKFEMIGEAIAFSDTDAKLIYDNKKFTDDVKIFSEIKIPKDGNKFILRGIPTILPLLNDQTVTIKIVPTPDESIMLLEGTKLIIHKVA